jgi:hypothetical protein
MDISFQLNRRKLWKLYPATRRNTFAAAFYFGIGSQASDAGSDGGCGQVP